MRPVDVIYVTRFGRIQEAGFLRQIAVKVNAMGFDTGPQWLSDGFEAGCFLMKCFNEEAFSLCVLNLDDAIFGIVEQGAEGVDIGLANQAFDGNEFSEQYGAIHEGLFTVRLWQNLVSGPFRALDVIRVTGCVVAGGSSGGSLALPPRLAAAIVLESA